MRIQGVDASYFTVSNTSDGNAEVARAVSSRNWSCWIVGLGLTQDRAWFERLIQIVKNTNPHVPLLDIRGPGDVENAILRHLLVFPGTVFFSLLRCF
jgi:hypothetical protein